jgi:hypothetical protein
VSEADAKEKKALVALVETLDAEVAQHKAVAQAAQEAEARMRQQLEQREAYWIERDEAWQLRMKTPQLDYAGLGNVIGHAVLLLKKSRCPDRAHF